MIRVVVADDHVLVRRGLRQVLDALTDVTVVGEASSGAEVVDAVRATGADVLLLDVSMPGGNFQELLATLREREPRVRTLVVSGHAEALYARRALQSGASGYITKDRAEEELVKAVRIVAGGGRYVSETLAQALATEVSVGRASGPHHALTDREHEVFLLLATGHTVTQIASRLGLSVKTVSTHRTRLLGKMGLETNAELVRYALAHGLIE
jgi:DNA-binding NarL/FixJ family response regulator